jgi:hypothetical protein
VCPDTITCSGCVDIGAAGFAIVTTGYGSPLCIAADDNCPAPGNPARVPWH